MVIVWLTYDKLPTTTYYQPQRITNYNVLLKYHSITILIKKPKNPPPNAKNIQNVPCLPALFFFDKSHMIKNKKAMNKGSSTFMPHLVTVSAEMANIIVPLNIL